MQFGLGRVEPVVAFDVAIMQLFAIMHLQKSRHPASAQHEVAGPLHAPSIASPHAGDFPAMPGEAWQTSVQNSPEQTAASAIVAFVAPAVVKQAFWQTVSPVLHFAMQSCHGPHKPLLSFRHATSDFEQFALMQSPHVGSTKLNSPSSAFVAELSALGDPLESTPRILPQPKAAMTAAHNINPTVTLRVIAQISPRAFQFPPGVGTMITSVKQSARA